MAWAQPANDNPFADPSVSAARSSNNAAAGGGDGDAPAWLRGGGGGSAPPPPPPPGGGPARAAASAAPTAESEAARAARAAEVPKMVLYMRVINVVLSVLLSATAALELIGTPGISAGVLACYLFAFSCLLCCFETHLKAVAKTVANNFGFLYNAKGRTFFLLFVGIICFSFGSILGIVSGVAMVSNAAFNLYVICKYPEVEENQQRKDLESEGKDFLRNNQGAIAKAGADFARNNPDQARAAARGAAAYV